MNAMSQGRSGFLLALAASLIVSTPAEATPSQRYGPLKHPKHERCRARYVKKVETIKKREHHKTVKIKETFCVYVAPNAVAKAPTPNAPAPIGIVTLHARLDPSFAQSPANPLAVTYSYSANATEAVNGMTNPVSNLPSGILSLFSDGLLKCSMNVGGSTAGGQCPVTYSTAGAQTVVTTYISGSTSATETDTEQVNPFATTASESAASDGCMIDEHTEAEYTEARCTYTVGARIFDSNGNAPPNDAGLALSGTTRRPKIYGGGEVAVSTGLQIPTGVSSCVLTIETWTYPGPGEEVHDNSLVKAVSGCTGSFNANGGGLLGFDGADVTSWSIVASYGGSLGWSASQSAPQTVNP